MNTANKSRKDIAKNNDFFRRLLMVIEALADGDGSYTENVKERFISIYKYAHLANIECIKNHPSWLEEFEKTEKALKEGNII